MAVKELSSSENILLERLLKSDEKAFNTLYLIHSETVFRRLKSLVHDREIVKELHQETFLTIWRKRESLKSNIPFQSILLRIAKSVAIDFYRKAVREDALRERLIKKATELYNHLEEYIEFNETNESINASIAKLPPKRLKIFTRIKIEGNSYESVANELGISLSTVKDHMAKALKFLRDDLSKNHPEVFLMIVTVTLFK